MRRVVWGVQDAAHLSRPSLVVSEQQSQVKTIIFFFTKLYQYFTSALYISQFIKVVLSVWLGVN